MDKKRRTLNQKERLVYAPMSGVGGVLYDKDAVYIDISGSHHMKQNNPEEMTPIKELVASLVQPAAAEDSEEGSDFE
jgi:ribosome biogenesis protein BMS1